MYLTDGRTKKILKTIFLTEEKRLIGTQNFRDKQIFQAGSTATAANRPDGRAARWEKNSSAAVLVSMPMS